MSPHKWVGTRVDKKHIFVGIAMISLFNGMFSPLLPVVLGIAPFWMPEWLEGSFSVVLYLAVLILSFTTMLVSGIPAAVFERATGSRESTQTSMYVWLGVAGLLSVPAVPVVAAL